MTDEVKTDDKVETPVEAPEEEAEETTEEEVPAEEKVEEPKKAPKKAKKEAPVVSVKIPTIIEGSKILSVEEKDGYYCIQAENGCGYKLPEEEYNRL